MDDLFGDVLPHEVTHRSTKAVFTEVFVAAHSRAFAQQWNGSGVDESLVDPDRLREVVAGPGVRRPNGKRSSRVRGPR